MGNQEKKKILIVEDDTILHETLKDYLGAEGFVVEGAIDGEAAIEKAKSFQPNLILLDIILPKKDGYEVIKEVRADQNLKDVPIVLLTNLGSLADVEKALQLGATTYLVKADYKMEEVVKKIETLIEVK